MKEKSPIPSSLTTDLELFKEPIMEVSREVLKKGISKYPVYIAHQMEINLGENILHKDELSTSWSINATIAEELIEKKIISEDKAGMFKQVFKDPREYICIFLITTNDANFIFVPFKK